MTWRGRRRFLSYAVAAAGVAVAAPLASLARRVSNGDVANAAGFGPLLPVRDEATGLTLLELPDGFRYRSVSWIGDALDGGARTPGAPDGMAAFQGTDGLVHLIRNHELAAGAAFAPALAYDALAAGGTTTVTLRADDASLVNVRPSLAGTVRNCAGGPTPWRSWLTCEETVLGPSVSEGSALEKAHGYVFDVPVDGAPTRTPLVAMGRFVHEAVAVDPRSGIVYQTEDARRAGLYRFVPATPGRLADGGRLQMMAVRGQPRLDLREGQAAGVRYGVFWVDIGDPDRPHADPAAADGSGVFSQGLEAGGAIFARLEGACYADGKLFVTSTDGGNARMGQVWELDVDRQELRLVFESPGADVLNMPDNLTSSPRGGLVLCEDGTANPCIHGLTTDGRVFRFARNTVRLAGERNGIVGDFSTSEFAGATFSPDGRWLFVNVQSPGITLAITGPWEMGII
jgi:secreted PhoX family phosphatase